MLGWIGVVGMMGGLGGQWWTMVEYGGYGGQAWLFGWVMVGWIWLDMV